MTLANKVTFLRLGLGLSAALLAHPEVVRGAIDIAILLFLLAISLDKIDGYLARKQGSVTDLGKFLDITADKIVLAVFFVWLLDMAVVSFPWVIAALMRDMLVQGFRSYAASQAIFVRTYLLSKVRYVLHVSAILASLVSFSDWLARAGVIHLEQLRFLSQTLFLLGVLLGYISLFIVIGKNWREVLGVPARKG